MPDKPDELIKIVSLTLPFMKYLLLILAAIFAGFISIDERPTLFLCGDSTMSNKSPTDAPETGWGMIVPEYFNTAALIIQNHAVNGRSTKNFRTLGHWKAVINQVKPGDYVLLQFGHNDEKISDTARYTAPQTDYRQNLTRFIEEIRAKGANPILATPVMRRKFTSDIEHSTLDAGKQIHTPSNAQSPMSNVQNPTSIIKLPENRR